MKHFKLTFVLIVLMSMVGLQAFAAWDTSTKVQVGDLYYYLDNDNNLAQVTSMPSGKYSKSDLTIPSSITYNTTNYSVTDIGYQAFYQCNISTVRIPNSVTSIGNQAFANSFLAHCYGIDNVTSFGRQAFFNCIYLDEIDLPSSVTYIGGSLVSGNTKISVYYSSNAKYASYYDYCIYEKSSKKLVSASDRLPSIPSIITSIGEYAFNGVTLTSLTIPSNVTNIDNYAFYNCNINSVILPTGLTSIGDYVFEYAKITSIEIPNTVTSLGRSAFDSCSNLTSITIPNSVTSIGNQAFLSCTRLTSVTIPYSVTSIGMQAFSYCSNLTSVTIGNSVTSIGERAFGYCNSLTEVTVERKTPITIATTTFSNRTNATLYVPLGCKEAYEAANIWKGFKEIKEIGKDMSSSDITINPISAVTYNGSAQTPTVTVKDGTMTLVNGTDYTVSYSNNINAGTATVTITGKGSYTGTKDANFTINPKNASNLNLTISSISAVTYNGSAQTPTVTVMDGSTTLTSGTHYTVAYSNNINAGTATVTITGTGNYTGTKNGNFTINKAPLTITAKSYTITEGDPLPSFECTYSGFKNGETESVLTTLPTITCDATDSETAGEYDITPSGAAATNYSFNYVNGTLTINEVPSVSIAVNSLGKGTYCSKYPLDFTNVSGIKAYIISGFNPSAGNLIITRVYEVPAGTGLFIDGTPGVTFNIPVKSTDFYYVNMMKGITVAKVIPTYEDGYTNYLLASDGHGGVIFRLAGGTATTSANRAYVQIPTSIAGTRSSLGMEEDGTTSVEGIRTPDTEDSEGDYYNLNGQKVQSLKRGIYIKNGKKIIIH